MHEPLTLFVCFPLFHIRPWTIKRTPFLEKLGRKLLGLWATEEQRCWDLLRQLFQRTGGFPSMPEGLVREVLFCPSWESLPDTPS